MTIKKLSNIIVIFLVVIVMISVAVLYEQGRRSVSVNSPNITPSLSEKPTSTAPTPSLSPSKSSRIASSLSLAVPFTPQAPTGNWDQLHNEACEEASAIMAGAYFSGDTRKVIPAIEVEKEISTLTQWEESHFGYHLDTTALETAEMIRSVYGLKASIVNNFTEREIKVYLALIELGISTIGPLSNKTRLQPSKVYETLEKLKDKIEKVNSEAEIIKKFAEIINERDVDVLVGYNSDNFDLEYIRNRMERAKQEVVLGRTGDSLKFKKKGLFTAVQTVGRVHIDLFHYASYILRGALGGISSRTLENVAQTFLGEGKKEIDIPLYKRYLIDKNITPLNLCKVKGEIRKPDKNYGVDLYDAYSLNGTVKTIIERIISFKADVVAFSSTTALIDNTFKIAGMIKGYDKRIKIVIGGSHATADPAHCLSNKNIDVALIGEGEISLHKTLQAFEHNKPLDEIEGIAYRKDNGKIITSKPSLM